MDGSIDSPRPHSPNKYLNPPFLSSNLLQINKCPCHSTFDLRSIVFHFTMATTTSEKFKAQFPDLEFLKLSSVAEHPHCNWTGFQPGLTAIARGHVRSTGDRAFPTDVLFDRDVAIPMRDGIKLYADIFRPVDSDTAKVPALITWSPYGKTGTAPQKYHIIAPFCVGLKKDQLSGYHSFEGPDPAEWCPRGYAVINIDARGAGMSEGDIHYWGQQEAEDIYDTIDWLSKQLWCNGSVGMMGNSWLAIAQINFASRLHHPALKALAPMEAFSDPYRETIARGGAPYKTVFLLRCRNYIIHVSRIFM